MTKEIEKVEKRILLADSWLALIAFVVVIAKVCAESGILTDVGVLLALMLMFAIPALVMVASAFLMENYLE